MTIKIVISPSVVSLFKSLSFWYTSLLFILLQLISGCAGVIIKEVSPKTQLTQRRSDVLTSGKLSSNTQEVLRIIGENVKNCARNVLSCQEILKKAPGLTEEQRMSALSELWLKISLASEQRLTSEHHTNKQIHNWLETVRYTYAYLFFTERSATDRAFEGRQIQIRDYYNYAVQRSVATIYAQYYNKQNQNNPQNNLQLSSWSVHMNDNTFNFTGRSLPYELINAESISFSGIRNIYQRDGFGADFVAIAPESSTNKSSEFIEQTYIPITALLQIKGKNLKEILASTQLSLQIYNPYKTNEITIRKNQVPIAGNFTANYGLWLARSGFAKQAVVNLFGRKGALIYPKLYLMQPYDPERKIVIMLHGLASSPEAWINVTNELLGDKNVRDQYQIWVIYYPTNTPIAFNRLNISNIIINTLQHLDPNNKHSQTKDITLIGHSMGGVISRLLVSESEQILFNAYEQQYPSTSATQQKITERIKPYLIFKPLPQVKSGIFIATPHHGSPVANNRIARWVGKLILLPANIIKQTLNLSSSTTGTYNSSISIPNSIENLSDKSQFMQLSSTLPIAPDIKYYSIIANRTPYKPLAESSDGVVPYYSAHLPGACSEKVIISSHSVQETPEAIVEIRRILMNQLQAHVQCQNLR